MNRGELTETLATQALDTRGWLDDSRQPGVYALRLADPPDDPEAVAAEWRTRHDVLPPEGFSERLADAGRLCYVGSHGRSVYERICQHARGAKSSTLVEIWPPVDVVAVWPCENPESEEYNRAVELAGEDTRVWRDGVLH